MQVVILGGSGFIGSALSRALVAEGDTVIIPSRLPRHSDSAFLKFSLWDGQNAKILSEIMEGTDAIINLVGESINENRWTPDVKAKIVQSRVMAGRAFMDAIKFMQREHRKFPKILVQGSAVGYYGFWEDALHAPLCTERSPSGKGFLASTCVEWENSTQEADSYGIRRCVVRTAPVVGKGGMLAKILPVFKYGLGGAMGSGLQPAPWIHIDDEVNAIIFLLRQEKLHGIFNLVSPDSVTMGEFAKILGEEMHKPSWFRVPAVALEARYGDMAKEMLLAGQKVEPEALLRNGYVFLFSSLRMALRDVLLKFKTKE